MDVVATAAVVAQLLNLNDFAFVTMRMRTNFLQYNYDVC